MIIVYDFKIPANYSVQINKIIKDLNLNQEDIDKDKELFVNYFIDYLKVHKMNNKTDDLNGFLPISKIAENLNAIILKKSVDLRQKEQKYVFKVILELNKLNSSKELEDEFISFLGKIGIKARKANNEEEVVFDEKDIHCRAENETAEKSGTGTEIALADKYGKTNNRHKFKIVIVGMGPAGIFAAVELLKNGIKPVLLEKGKRVEQRIEDVENLFNNAIFNERSNAVFGEGGAGTFSDGKLTTRKKDSIVSYVLNFLVEMGADKRILTEHKPHLGSDNLIYILKEIRKYLYDNGAQIYFEEELKDFDVDEKGRVHTVKTDKRVFETDCIILAAGANSYDLYKLLFEKGAAVERKPFAIGFRIEHKRDFIDSLFFKGNIERVGKVGKAGAKLRGVYYNIASKEYGGYSFCMCPGGIVINASAGKELLCVNGMSYSGRDLENSNSAIVAAVRPEMLDGYDFAGNCDFDYDYEDLEAGNKIKGDRYSSETGALEFRKDLEFKAFNAGGGNFGAPYQYTIDYINDVFVNSTKNTSEKTRFFNNININNRNKNNYKNGIKKIIKAESDGIPTPSYKPCVKYFNLFKLLPSSLNLSIANSLIEFENKFKGFASKSILTGLETGTSSAVRIKRNLDFESVSIKGLYPCGEGSGYSGGIITSAIDGIRCARAVIAKKHY